MLDGRCRRNDESTISLLQWETGDRLRWMRCYKVRLRKSALEKPTPHPSYSRCSYATFSHRRRLIIRRFVTFFRRGGVSPPVFTLQSNVFGRGDPSPTVSIGRETADPRSSAKQHLAKATVESRALSIMHLTLCRGFCADVPLILKAAAAFCGCRPCGFV